MKLIISGDSHTEALAQGLAILKKDSLGLVSDVAVRAFGNGRYLAEPFFASRDCTIHFLRADYAATYESFGVGPLRQGTHVLHGFCMGFHTAPLFRDPMWRAYTPWRIYNDLGGVPLSDAIIETLANDIWQHIRNFFETAAGLGIPFFVIAAPPPRRSHRCIQEGTPPRTVIEVDRLFRNTVAQWLALHNVAVFTPPGETTDSDGFLLPEFEATELANDHHHANAKYGALLLKQILSVSVAKAAPTLAFAR